MLVNGRDTRSIRLAEPPREAPVPEIIDQTRLPHELRFVLLETLDDAERSIREMWVRGAPLIGVTAAYGMALAARTDPSTSGLESAARRLSDTRPTAVNLEWALSAMVEKLRPLPPADREAVAFEHAAALADTDVAACQAIGLHGSEVLEKLVPSGAPAERLQILTHCNAGWLATVDWGTALAPVYRAHRAGLPLHVWVSETRPRNQGAGLTAWELGEEGIPHTVIPDNASGHLLRTGRVDVVIAGTDRTTSAGDVCNKIGTYLKAVAAHDCGVPFYAAVPGSSIDWKLGEGEAESIPIEERDGSEVSEVRGLAPDGRMTSVRITPAGCRVANFGFDVTPARLVTGLITERGVCVASREGLASLFPDRASGKDARG
ncbi:MAG: S-methyl-5-thioribose-1-phosphate isomerase [marine benthic group bacterium]|nr:S-methyl-5-thioribose-1-phosphate isomerase [Gemmatimonadota bacterium]